MSYQDPHWLQQFYTGWSLSDLEARLNHLMFTDNASERAQVQAEINRREVETLRKIHDDEMADYEEQSAIERHERETNQKLERARSLYRMNPYEYPNPDEGGEN